MNALEENIPSLFEGVVEAFMAYLELERALAKNTTQSYIKDLAQCAQFLNERGVQGWADAKSNHIALWITSLSLDEYAVASLARKLSAVRMLGRFMVKERFRKDDFTERITGPKLVRRLPGTLSVSEVDALLQAPDLSTPHGLRDKAIFELLYSSGLRISELCGLTLQDIYLEEGFIRVMGKGSKERGVPVGSKALDAIRHYLAVGRLRLVKNKTGSELFISQWGRAISRKTVWLMIKAYAKKAGIDKNVKPHLLRHSFATHLLSNGANLRAIQEMLGHADIATTEIYTSLDSKNLMASHEAYHPRAQRRDKA